MSEKNIELFIFILYAPFTGKVFISFVFVIIMPQRFKYMCIATFLGKATILGILYLFQWKGLNWLKV